MGALRLSSFFFLVVAAVVAGAWPASELQRRNSIAAAPSFFPFAPTQSALPPAPARDAMPVLPTPGGGSGGGFAASGGSLPVIPSSPSPPNPDEPLPTLGMAPFGGPIASAAFPLRRRFALAAVVAAWPVVLLLLF